MADVVMLLVVTGVFILCAAYVAVCDRIIGPDPTPVEPVTGEGVRP